MSQEIIEWSTPIKADWVRANDFVSLSLIRGERFRLIIREESSRKQWLIEFDWIQAFRFLTEELSWPLKLRLQEDSFAGFFKVRDSEWMDELAEGKEGILQGAEHFIIFCYDEVIEVVGGGVSFEEVPGQ
jgi:hypothetical protein